MRYNDKVKSLNVVESYLFPGGMAQTDSRWRYDPSTMKLTNYFSLGGNWNLFISGQLLERFLGDLLKLSSLDTMRNPSLNQSVDSMSRSIVFPDSLRKCLESSGHSYCVIPISLYGTYCWGHSPVLTDHNYVLKWCHKYVNEGWWNLGHRTCLEVCAYLQGGPDLQAGPDFDRGLALT